MILLPDESWRALLKKEKGLLRKRRRMKKMKVKKMKKKVMQKGLVLKKKVKEIVYLK